ncbi:MAG TPA: hypothetical protein VGD46_00435, partial [Rhizobacter sp.]
MKLNPLNATLVAAGVLAMGTAGAFSLKPWFQDKSETAETPPAVVAAATPSTAPTAVATAGTAAAGAMAPVAPIPAQAVVPNYRAIFAQAGPAVVGVTVSG